MEVGDALADGALDALDAALDAVAALTLNMLTARQRVAMLDRIEHHTRRLPAVVHPILAGLTAETTPKELGVKSWRDVLSTTLRISRAEAGRRMGDTEQLGPRTHSPANRSHPCSPSPPPPKPMDPSTPSTSSSSAPP